MKKFIINIFVFVVLLSLVSCATNSDNYGGTKSIYNTTQNNSTTVSVFETSAKSGDITEKEYTYDKNTKTLTINVQEINYDYYKEPWIDIEYPENIVFKKGITKIPDFGFAFSVHGNGGQRLNNYDRIKTVSLPSTIKAIGCEAFFNCKSLKKINIPSGVKKIGESAFEMCDNLAEITIPGSVKNLPYGLFSYCKKLENVNIKNGVRKIEDYVFFDCNKLKSVKIPNSVTSIGNAFSHCNSLVKIRLPKELKTIKIQTFYSCKKLKKVTIQNKVTKIEKFAFDNCINLKEIIVPKSVKTIGKKAFGYKEKWIDNGTLEYESIKGFTIKGYKGTAAEKYAKDNNFKFVAM